MKWEHKIGIAITCTFLCLVGAVLGLKMQEQTPSESQKVAESVPGEPTPVMPEKKSSIPIDNKMLFSKNPETPLNPVNKAPNAAGSPGKNGEPPAFTAGWKPPSRDERRTPESTNPPMGPAVSPSGPVESSPTLPRISGAEEWGQYSSGSEGNKKSLTPDTSKNGPKAAPPAPLSGEVKKQQPANPPVSPMIVPASGTEPPLNPSDSQPKSIPTPTSPTPLPSPTPGTGTTPAPITPAPITLDGPKSSAAPPAPPAMTFPSLQPPTTAPNALDPKDNIIPYPGSGSTNPPTLPKTTSSPARPLTPTMNPATGPSMNPASGPSMNPAIGSPMPVSPTLPPTTTAPPLAPMPAPIVNPNPAPPLAPAPSPAPASPPKPAVEGSTFIPDQSASTSGPVGVKPAPLPFPVPPPSSPLVSAPERPASPSLQPLPASTGASVTFYDEQEYSSKNGDTWEEISKRFYMGTDRYAKALQRHNQNHARASARVRDTGQLAAGERVFIPQSYVLEERYADAIPRPTAAPASTAMPATFVSPGSTPPPPPAPPQP